MEKELQVYQIQNGNLNQEMSGKKEYYEQIEASVKEKDFII